MSGRQTKKTRYNQKLEFIAMFEHWLDCEPSILRVFAWHKWKNRKPRKGW